MRRIAAALVLISLAGCEWFDNGPAYDVVRVQLRGDVPDVLSDTSEVKFELRYLECLADFYEDDPEARLEDGRDAPTGWEQRLCDDAELGTSVPCSVTQLQQELGTRPRSLSIRFVVSTDLQGQTFALGPLPDPETAGCGDRERAEVQLAPDSPLGLGGNGLPRWTSVEDPPPTAVVGRSTPVVVLARRVDE
jgi:hypothetical protein